MTNKNLTVRELIAILETHNPDAVIKVRDNRDIWAEITIHDVTAHSEECIDYVFIGD